MFSYRAPAVTEVGPRVLTSGGQRLYIRGSNFGRLGVRRAASLPCLCCAPIWF